MAVAISAFAYFIAHTVHKPRAVVSTQPSPDPRIGLLEEQVKDLKSRQEGLLAQQAESEKQKKRRQELRKKLGEFLGRGQQLMLLCADEQKPAPEEAANKWGAETENYLRNYLGSEYVARFRSGAGMPLAATSITDTAHRNLWAALNVRVYRLEQFLSELKD